VQAILLGLLLLGGVALIGVTVYAVGSRKWFWNDSFHVRAGFDSVQGVEIGTKVRIKGMDAGEVIALEAPLSTEDQVLLRIRINGKLRHLVRQNATVQIVSVGMLGGKAVEINPGTSGAPPAEDDALLTSKKTAEITDVLDQVSRTLDQAVEGKGTIGMLSRDPQAYESLVAALKSVDRTAQIIGHDAESLKKVPILGGYIEDPRALLDRPGHERNRKVFPESDLFEPGRSSLTGKGKGGLDRIGDWIDGLKHSGSEVVVVAYADPTASDADMARKLSQEQAKAVLDYLKDKHKVHKVSLVSWRKATALGMGIKPPPVPERDKLPAPRVEIQVFVPQR